jgi:hypothetical protein
VNAFTELLAIEMEPFGVAAAPLRGDSNRRRGSSLTINETRLHQPTPVAHCHRLFARDELQALRSLRRNAIECWHNVIGPLVIEVVPIPLNGRQHFVPGDTSFLDTSVARVVVAHRRACRREKFLGEGRMVLHRIRQMSIRYAPEAHWGFQCPITACQDLSGRTRAHLPCLAHGRRIAPADRLEAADRSKRLCGNFSQNLARQMAALPALRERCRRSTCRAPSLDNVWASPDHFRRNTRYQLGQRMRTSTSRGAFLWS